MILLFRSPLLGRHNFNVYINLIFLYPRSKKYFSSLAGFAYYNRESEKRILFFNFFFLREIRSDYIYMFVARITRIVTRVCLDIARNG